MIAQTLAAPPVAVNFETVARLLFLGKVNKQTVRVPDFSQAYPHSPPALVLPPSPLSGLEEVLAAASEKSHGTYSLYLKSLPPSNPQEERERRENYGIYVIGKWGDGMQAFAALREFNVVYSRIVHWRVNRVNSLEELTLVTDQQARGQYPSKFSPSLVWKVHEIIPGSDGLPDDVQLMVVTLRLDPSRGNKTVLKMLEEKGFVLSSFLDHGFVADADCKQGGYFMYFGEWKKKYVIGQKMLIGFNEDYAMTVATRMRQAFADNAIHGEFYLTSFLKDRDIVLTPILGDRFRTRNLKWGDVLYACDARGENLIDNFGTHERRAARR